MLDVQDEHWHTPTSHKHWNESFYFNFFDSNTAWACAMRIGASPNVNSEDGFICLYLPDNTTGFTRLSLPFRQDRAKIAVGAMEVRCAAPFRRWNILYDGPIDHYPDAATPETVRRTLTGGTTTKHLTLDLVFESQLAPFDFDERKVRLRPLGDTFGAARGRSLMGRFRDTVRTIGSMPAMLGANHYEQAGTIRGTLSLDGESTELAGVGQRDHSWGVRDMRAPANWRWLSCQFGQDLCFNVTQVDILGMRVHGGFVHHGGVTDALDDVELECAHTSGPYWPEAANLILTTQSGARFELQAEVTTPLPVVAETTDKNVVVTASRALYRWGDRTTYGMVEFMERLS